MKYGPTINNFRTFCALVLGVHFDQYSLKNDAAHENNLPQPYRHPESKRCDSTNLSRKSYESLEIESQSMSQSIVLA